MMDKSITDFFKAKYLTSFFLPKMASDNRIGEKYAHAYHHIPPTPQSVFKALIKVYSI